MLDARADIHALVSSEALSHFSFFSPRNYRRGCVSPFGSRYPQDELIARVRFDQPMHSLENFRRQ